MFVGIVKRRFIPSENQESENRGFNSTMTNTGLTSPLFKGSQSNSINMPSPTVTNLNQTMTKTYGGGLIKGGSYASFSTNKESEVTPPILNNNDNDDLDGVMQLEEDLHPEGVKSSGSLPPARCCKSTSSSREL